MLVCWIPYASATLCAFSKWPLTRATDCDSEHSRNAGMISSNASWPKPTIAHPALRVTGSGTFRFGDSRLGGASGVGGNPEGEVGSAALGPETERFATDPS